MALLVDLVAKIRTEISDTDSGRFTDAEIELAINDAYKQVCIRSLCYKAMESMDTEDPFDGMELLSIFSPQTVFFDGIKIPKLELEGITKELSQPGGESINMPEYWYMLSPRVINFFPSPTAINKKIVVYGRAIPDSIAAEDTKLTALPIGFDRAVIDGALWLLRRCMYLSEENIALANLAYTQFETIVNVIALSQQERH